MPDFTRQDLIASKQLLNKIARDHGCSVELKYANDSYVVGSWFGAIRKQKKVPAAFIYLTVVGPEDNKSNFIADLEAKGLKLYDKVIRGLSTHNDGSLFSHKIDRHYLSDARRQERSSTPFFIGHAAFIQAYQTGYEKDIYRGSNWVIGVVAAIVGIVLLIKLPFTWPLLILPAIPFVSFLMERIFRDPRHPAIKQGLPIPDEVPPAEFDPFQDDLNLAIKSTYLHNGQEHDLLPSEKATALRSATLTTHHAATPTRTIATDARTIDELERLLPDRSDSMEGTATHASSIGMVRRRNATTSTSAGFAPSTTASTSTLTLPR